MAENPINDSLLGKYLAGETTAEEAEQVRRWLAEGPVEQQEFARFEKIWETAGEIGQPAPVDTDKAWARMKSRMAALPVTPEPEPLAAPETPVIPLGAQPISSTRVAWRTYWRLAASVVLILGMGWLVWKRTQPQRMAQLAVRSSDQTIERILPDGTKVWLNRNSRLSYPQQFAENSREISLSGEAFFEVSHDPQRPFRIKAGQATIQVLGTSFGVRAYDENVRVAVRTGKVQFTAKTKKVILNKDEQATFEAREDTIRKAPRLDPNLLAFQTGKLVFEGQRLSEIVTILRDTYQADIQLGNQQLADCRLTARFENESLDTVLAVAAESLGLRIRRQGRQIFLDGTGCQ